VAEMLNSTRPTRIAVDLAYISAVKKEISSDMNRIIMNTQLTIDMIAPVYVGSVKSFGTLR